MTKCYLSFWKKKKKYKDREKMEILKPLITCLALAMAIAWFLRPPRARVTIRPIVVRGTANPGPVNAQPGLQVLGLALKPPLLQEPLVLLCQRLALGRQACNKYKG